MEGGNPEKDGKKKKKEGGKNGKRKRETTPIQMTKSKKPLNLLSANQARQHSLALCSSLTPSPKLRWDPGVFGLSQL